MPKSSSSLKSEIAGLPNDDPASRISPLRQEQIKQQLLKQVQSIPQNSSSILNTIKNFFFSSSFTEFGFIALAVILLGGFTTIGAAHAAKPGDALYNLKLKTEQLQIALTFDAESKAELQSKFIEARLQERAALEAKSQTDNSSNKENTGHASKSSDNDIKPLNNAIQNLQTIEAKLEQKGNTNAAAKVHENVEKFKSRVTEIEAKQSEPINKIIEKGEKTEKKTEQNSKPNVTTDIESRSSTEVKIETPKINVEVEADAKSTISTDKLIK
jgi:hypothetical protein